MRFEVGYATAVPARQDFFSAGTKDIGTFLLREARWRGYDSVIRDTLEHYQDRFPRERLQIRLKSWV